MNNNNNTPQNPNNTHHNPLDPYTLVPEDQYDPILRPDSHSLTSDPYSPIPEDRPLAYTNQLAAPFSIYNHSADSAQPQPQEWLWQDRLPLSGITLLDGDHGCGKSILALQLAACVSSGSPMPDGSPTIQGGVVIISPTIPASSTQLELLTSLGADLTRIRFLSFIQDRETEYHTSGYHPFTCPNDLTTLFDAIREIDARLVILDPFITLLSRDRRWTNDRLGHLLIDLNQRLIERNVACLLLRSCAAKGGHSRPSVLEKSDHFPITSAGRLLLAPHPMQPDQLLLTHVLSHRSTLAPTLILQIQASPEEPAIPHISVLGTHPLIGQDFLEYRPDTLHRRLLCEHLKTIIDDATNHVPVRDLYARFTHSSFFQIQRALNDLINMGQVIRPSRGSYYSTHPKKPHTINISSDLTPTEPSNSSIATRSNSDQTADLNSFATTRSNSDELNTFATTTLNPEQLTALKSFVASTLSSASVDELKAFATIPLNSEQLVALNSFIVRTLNSASVDELNTSAAILSNSNQTSELNSSAAIPSNSEHSTEFNSSVAIPSNSNQTSELNSIAATTLNPEPAAELNSPAAIPNPTQDDPPLNESAATTPPYMNLINLTGGVDPNYLAEKLKREAYMDPPRYLRRHRDWWGDW